MGWKSTMDITRKDALGEIMKRLLGASDVQLANILEELASENADGTGLYGHNFRVVANYADDDWEPKYRRG
jgi:hypothetical protein